MSEETFSNIFGLKEFLVSSQVVRYFGLEVLVDVSTALEIRLIEVARFGSGCGLGLPLGDHSFRRGGFVHLV